MFSLTSPSTKKVASSVRTKSYSAPTWRAVMPPETSAKNGRSSPAAGGRVRTFSGRSGGTWSRGWRAGSRRDTWRGRSGLRRSEWWLLTGRCLWIGTMRVCRVGRCSLCGDCCSFWGGTLGWCLMWIWCLIAWISQLSTGLNTKECLCLSFGIAPQRNTLTSLFRIGLSGVGKIFNGVVPKCHLFPVALCGSFNSAPMIFLPLVYCVRGIFKDILFTFTFMNMVWLINNYIS